MQKKILSLVLTLCMLLSMFPFAILTGAEEAVEGNEPVVVEEPAVTEEAPEESTDAPVETTDPAEDPEAPNPFAVFTTDENGNYLITSADDMVTLSALVNGGNDGTGASFLVTDDITLPADFAPIGAHEGDGAGKYFKGTFDGGDNTITINMTAASAAGTGIFGLAGDGAVIKNVNVAGALTTAYANSGALIGIAYGSITVQNCSNAATVAASGGVSDVAGLIGLYSSQYHNNAVAVIENLTNNGAVTGNATRVGGVVGGVRAITTGSYTLDGLVNNADVGSEDAKFASANVGGVFGALRIEGGKSGAIVEVTNSYNTGDVYSSAAQAGGFVGSILADNTKNSSIHIKDCYNTGAVVAKNVSAGFAGYVLVQNNADNAVITIENCYNAGTVNGDAADIGGIAGKVHYQTSAKNSHVKLINVENKKDATVEGTADLGGIIGLCFMGTTSGNNGVTVSGAVNNATVTGTSTYYGGIVGYLNISGTPGNDNKFLFENCVNTGKITGSSNQYGGIFGRVNVLFDKSSNPADTFKNSTVTFSKCVNTGEVSSTAGSTGAIYLGGIGGVFSGGGKSTSNTCSDTAKYVIDHCVNTGKISAPNRGGEIESGGTAYSQTAGSFRGFSMRGNPCLNLALCYCGQMLCCRGFYCC